MIVIRCWLLLLLTCLAFVPAAQAQPDLATGQEVRSLTFSPDGKLLALAVGSAGELGVVAHRLEIWDVATGQRRHSLKCDPQVFTFLTFSPDGNRLLSSGVRSNQVQEHHGRIVLWDTQTGHQIHELELAAKETVFIPVFSPDGALVAGSVFGMNNQPYPAHLKVWDAKTGGLKHEVADLGIGLSQVSFTPDGKHLIVAIAEKLDDPNIGSRLIILEGDSLRPSHSVSVEVTEPTGFIVAPDSQSLAHFYVTQNEGQPGEFHLNVMSLQGDRAPLALQMEIRQVSLSAFRFTPDGDQFSAVASFFDEQRPVELWRWDTKTGQRLSALPVGEFSMLQAMFAAVTPDAQTLAIARGTTVELRRTSDGKLLRSFDVF